MNNIYIPPVVKNLLIINILFFLATLYFQSQGTRLEYVLGAFYFDSPLAKPWQPITYMFMHGGWAHIFFNMFALYSFGTLLESRWGIKKFITFYLITGLGALALQLGVQAFETYQLTGTIFNPHAVSVDFGTSMVQANVKGLNNEQLGKLIDIYTTPMVGASGAIFGLLVAFGMLYPNAELLIMFIPVPVKAKYIIPVYILVELSLGVAQIQGDSVAHYAHLGGALIGFILVKIWKDKNDTFYTLYE
ncbi:rhomboid family intramembrane serine protease [Pedobacter sp.]|uniref:rhomboid family intramembrane serine protease n=1 Tax=Pedobacter sp. TaxID=1411316 RepID=UPI003BA9BC53